MPAPARAADEWEADRRRATRQLLALCRWSFIVVGLSPFALSLIRAALPIEPAGGILDLFYVTVCHRLPARTLSLFGVAMPVCSRCAGVFAGLALGAAIARPRLSLAQARLGLLIAALLMVIDVGLQDFGVHPVWHATRLGTGFALGYVATAALVAAILREREAIHARPLKPSRSSHGGLPQ